MSVLAREGLDEPLEQLQRVAAELGIELGAEEPDLVVVLGGDGAMLRALKQHLGTGVPTIGVNYGRVGFLTSIPSDELEPGLRRAFSGELRVTELPTLEVELDGQRHVGVNDVVATSSVLGRMLDIAWALGDEDLGVMGCDGIVCSTPSGSTASRPQTSTGPPFDRLYAVDPDGVEIGRLQPGARAAVRLGPARSLLASLPEVTFFRRYRDAFGSP